MAQKDVMNVLFKDVELKCDVTVGESHLQYKPNFMFIK